MTVKRQGSSTRAVVSWGVGFLNLVFDYNDTASFIMFLMELNLSILSFILYFCGQMFHCCMFAFAWRPALYRTTVHVYSTEEGLCLCVQLSWPLSQRC